MDEELKNVAKEVYKAYFMAGVRLGRVDIEKSPNRIWEDLNRP